MLPKYLITGVILASMTLPPRVDAAEYWSGYINDKSLSGGIYGYLSSISHSGPSRKLRIVCHSDGMFAIYIEKGSTDTTSITKITVDGLPAVKINPVRIGDSVVVANQHPKFWRLIAQMSAGAMIKIESGDGGLHQYGLWGFTRTFLRVCGWSVEATRFQQYLHQYR